MPAAPAPLPIAVLVSGQGSNLQAIIGKAPHLNVEVRAVISDRATTPALERAPRTGVPDEAIAPQD